MREREKGRDGCHGYFPGDASTLVYLLAEGACAAGPLAEQMCVCACLCVHVCSSARVCGRTCVCVCVTNTRTGNKLNLQRLSL